MPVELLQTREPVAAILSPTFFGGQWADLLGTVLRILTNAHPSNPHTIQVDKVL